MNNSGVRRGAAAKTRIPSAEEDGGLSEGDKEEKEDHDEDDKKEEEEEEEEEEERRDTVGTQHGERQQREIVPRTNIELSL
ncbi:hypothetical protein E2C01_001653 [Portunus trituberculatus]|uniref:Uncharacterized protein n=1 Tax=Portunus trituberculatus TaxID=210409 RepID=A0A5B7CJT7_PORTR|nr:hypothetical protein [Portunus trituberculatus]